MWSRVPWDNECVDDAVNHLRTIRLADRAILPTTSGRCLLGPFGGKSGYMPEFIAMEQARLPVLTVRASILVCLFHVDGFVSVQPTQ